jgi:hypothetical protein
VTISYTDYVEHVLHEHLDVRCGDTIELRLSSLRLKESSGEQTQRLLAQCMGGLGLIPHEMHVPPAHFRQLSRRSIDVLLAKGHQHWDVDGTTIPTHIPYVANAELGEHTITAVFRVDLCVSCRATRDLVAVSIPHGKREVLPPSSSICFNSQRA